MARALQSIAGSEHGAGAYRIDAAGHAAHDHLTGSHRPYYPRRERR